MQALYYSYSADSEERKILDDPVMFLKHLGFEWIPKGCNSSRKFFLLNELKDMSTLSFWKLAKEMGVPTTSMMPVQFHLVVDKPKQFDSDDQPETILPSHLRVHK